MKRDADPVFSAAPRIPRNRPGVIPCGLRWYHLPLLRWAAITAVSLGLWALIIVVARAVWSAVMGALQ